MDFNQTLVDNLPLTKRVLKIQKLLNTILHRVGMKADVAQYLNNGADMVTLYQKMNLFHFLNNLLDSKIDGEVVEMGCYDGQTATLFQTIIQSKASQKKLILFDNFKHDFGNKSDIKQELISNFKSRNLDIPTIVEGYFHDTISGNLPGKICFLHIDCGYGGDVTEHKNTIVHILKNTYDRLSPGAIVVLMDYHIPGVTVGGVNSNPGVKLACDEFFLDKPEKLHTLFGGMFSHGYFRKEAV